MKRPPGLWLLLSAGVLWLSVQDVYCVKATSLIFGKTSTTTTDTPSSSSPSNEENASEAPAATTEASNSTGNVTKSPLTGIPQIDYIWDPNLPKELNGYNLTEYPFYERVPEDIDFKCDGLHDGFYASVPHKCQVYHHCLFGTRYDFLCANYTAFDQKTFICHFVSEVDCVNSKKFWHRNDALYKAAETTTVKPAIVYTPPPQPSQPPPPPVALPSAPAAPRRPAGGNGGRRQRPFRRRRPQYDYYDYEDYDGEKDDYYDDPRYQVTPDPPRRRKRPRPRPRPIYDDEYDDYEDDRYERRGSGRRDSDRDRRPYDRRGSDDRRYDDRRPTDRKRNKNDRRKYEDQDDDRYEDDTYMRRKRPPHKDRDIITEERRTVEKRTNEDRQHDKRRPMIEDDDYDRRNTRKGHRRPADDNYENDRPSKTNKQDQPKEEERKVAEEHKTMIKPSSGSSIYDRPRAPPKIRPPVPKNEQDKYAYKPISLKVPDKEQEEEYYDDYEEDIKKIPPPKKHDEIKRPPIEDDVEEDRKPFASSNRPRSQSKKTDYSYEDDERDTRFSSKRHKYGDNTRDRRVEITTTTTTTTKKPLSDDYYDDYEDYGKPLNDDPRTHKDTVDNKSKNLPSREETTTAPSTTTTTTIAITTKTIKHTFKERPDPIIRVVKRPFLPSRGGNPYAARGLQPVGIKAIDIKKPTTARPSEQDHEAPYLSEVRSEERKNDNRKEQENKQYRPTTKNSDRGTMSYSKSTATEEPQQSQSNEDTRHHNRQPSSSVEEAYEERIEERPVFKPSPILVKVPVRSKYTVPINEENEDFRPVSNRPITPIKQNQDNEPRATHKPKLSEKNPLDIIENEYDVTLNDALNPTLPNLPIRGFPTGFSSSNHYTYSSFQRPRYDAGLTQAGSDYSYQIKSPQQRYEPQNSYRNNAGPQQFVNTNTDYTGQYTSLIAQTNQNYRPRITQAQTHPFFGPY